MEPLIEYLFGTGDGVTTTWTSPADVDVDANGTPDAVLLDFDGDGSRDDAMWDSDGDALADAVILDVDVEVEGDAGRGDEGSGAGGGSADTGAEPRIYRDTGRGLWDQRVWDAVDSGRLPGEPDDTHDLDGDARPDVRIRSTPQGRELVVDSDGDGSFDRIIVDSDGDGRADATREATPSD